MDVLKYMLFAWVLFPASLWAQGDIYSIFSKSYQLENDGQFAEAAAVLEGSRQNSYAVNLRLGWLYYQGGQYTVSLGYYSKAISLKPTSVEARLGYVLPAAKLKAWSSVGAQYDAILKLDPNNYKANYYRGLMFYNMGNYKEAMDYAKKADASGRYNKAFERYRSEWLRDNLTWILIVIAIILCVLFLYFLGRSKSEKAKDEAKNFPEYQPIIMTDADYEGLDDWLPF